MTVLLSIKPEFAYKIFDGSKRYEYRKSIFKRDGISKVIVYASSPVKKVIGEFMIEDILKDAVETIWNETALESGISKRFFMTYFENKQNAYAIKIGRTTKYKKTKELSDFNVSVAPQSFTYLEKQ